MERGEAIFYLARTNDFQRAATTNLASLQASASEMRIKEEASFQGGNHRLSPIAHTGSAARALEWAVQPSLQFA
jgi:hypothetical protein